VATKELLLNVPALLNELLQVEVLGKIFGWCLGFLGGESRGHPGHQGEKHGPKGFP
jgi:hypothetical protein